VSREEFAFLSKEAKDGLARIKARRLRGTFSMGLLVKAQPGAKLGSNKQKELGIEKYLPPAEREPTQREFSISEKSQRIYKSWPWWKRTLARWFPRLFVKKHIACPVYDIEGYRKHKGVLIEGEEVIITEKIHGANLRAVYANGKFHLGSRTTFGRDKSSDWGVVADRYGLAEKLKAYPNLVVLGEVYGNVQDLKYGKPNSVDLVLFDAMDLKTRKFLDWKELCSLARLLGIPTVPELYVGSWKAELIGLSEGKTTMPFANHVREGIVVKPMVNRYDPHFGRVILKLAGEGYLTRKEQ
jgi:RNA ligase